LDKQTMLMLWNQIKIFYYRLCINDLFYSGHTSSSEEVMKMSRMIDNIVTSEIKAKTQYKESQQIISDGGQP